MIVTVVCCCLLLFVAVCCCFVVFVIVRYCLMLYVVACCCLFFFACSSLLFECDCGHNDVDVEDDHGCDYSGDHVGNDHDFLSEGLQSCHCAHIATYIFFGLLGRLHFDNLIKVTDWFRFSP